MKEQSPRQYPGYKKQQQRKDKNFKSDKIIEDCFRIMKVKEKDDEVYVPACVQFKIRNFTQVNFENLVAQVNGVLCINFLIFTQNKQLQDFLCDRLYFNPLEQQILSTHRRKRINRKAFNYVPIMFNKDDNIKIPTTRTKEFQIQSYKTDIFYNKNNALIKGKRIFHTLRKQFYIQIKKNGAVQNFLAPFDHIKLQLVISLEHMDVQLFDECEQKQQNQSSLLFEKKQEKGQKKQFNEQKIYGQSQYYKGQKIAHIKKIHFNCLRIEQPFLKKNIDIDEKTLKMSSMIAYSSQEPYGKYDVVQTQLESYTHDEREFKEQLEDDLSKEQLFHDLEPTQLHFKPFKYAVFKIPMYRYPVVDMMTIFIPLWLLSFISVYIYFQTAQIMNRIVNVAGLMIAYAALQPIVRQNIPEATSITLVDLLIYSELLINILFLCRSIQIRIFSDDPPTSSIPIELTNSGYGRWNDWLFIASLAIAIINLIIVVVLIIKYRIKKQGYKAKPLPRSTFSISDNQNWTLSLLMDRIFARYRQTVIFIK